MSKYRSFIKNWLIISFATCIFSYMLWALMDFDMFVRTGFTFEDLCFDFAYCSFYALFSLWVSNVFGNILVKGNISYPRFATHIFLLLIFNLAWAVTFENIFDTFFI